MSLSSTENLSSCQQFWKMRELYDLYSVQVFFFPRLHYKFHVAEERHRGFGQIFWSFWCHTVVAFPIHYLVLRISSWLPIAYLYLSGVFILLWFLSFEVDRKGARAAASFVSYGKVGNGHCRLFLLHVGAVFERVACTVTACLTIAPWAWISPFVSNPWGREGRLTQESGSWYSRFMKHTALYKISNYLFI